MQFRQNLTNLKNFLAVMLSVVILTGCTAPATPKNIDTNSNTVNEVFDLEINMANFSYSPNTISASPGQTLLVKLINLESQHDFRIDDLELSSRILNAGESDVLSITIPGDDKPGKTYEFYCSISNHRAMGMVGTLTVK